MIEQSLSLLDILAQEADCKILSDLHSLMGAQRKRLHNYLKSIPICDFSEDEWNDALAYITMAEKGDLPSGVAQRKLIDLLS